MDNEAHFQTSFGKRGNATMSLPKNLDAEDLEHIEAIFALWLRGARRRLTNMNRKAIPADFGIK